MIKGIIFDIGGVLLRTHDQSYRRKWETRLGLEPGGAARLIFDSDLGRQAQLGRVTLQDVWAWAGELLGLSAGDLADFERDFWAGDRLDRDLARTVRELHAHYRTALLSNSWVRDGWALADELGLADAFDVCVVSAEVGVVKPDPRIYHITLERLGVLPAEAVFVDDFVENVVAARRIGMQAIHFTDPLLARQQLEDVLRPGSADFSQSIG
jgi:epoxide hydrolase-like predicted phosphatase